MEEVSYFFNADFESSLFNNKKFLSNKFNWEFEYLLFYLLEHPNVYTLKKYSKSYLHEVEALTGNEVNLSQKFENAVPWLSNSDHKKMKQSLQDKVSLYRLLGQEGALPSESRIISNADELKENFLYKSGRSSSGMGHFVYPLHREKIKKMIDHESYLIEEPIRNRVLDFSTLIQNDEILLQYQNYVDRNFQYKGTLIGLKPSLTDKHEKILLKYISLIRKASGHYNGIYSIDSYLYIKNGEVKIFPICEVNMRATMGYIAYQLKRKFAPSYKLAKFTIKKQNKSLSRRGGNYIMLSPSDTKFSTYLIFSNELEGIDLIEKSLDLA